MMSGLIEFSAVVAWVNLRKFFNIFLCSWKGVADTKSCPDDQVISSQNGGRWFNAFNYSISVGTGFAFILICAVLTPRLLSVYPVFKNVFKFGRPAFFSSESFYCLFAIRQFFALLSPTSHHQLIRSLRAAVLFPSVTVKSIAFKLKDASNAFLCFPFIGCASFVWRATLRI